MKNLILKNENLNPYKKFKFIKDKKQNFITIL